MSASSNASAAPSLAPELVVLSQSYSGQLTAGSLDAMRQAAPLTRLVRVLGSWCEGEPRSGNPPPGCLNVYWHQWPTRDEREQAELHAGRLPSWAVPVTWSNEERTLWESERPLSAGDGLVVIYAPAASTAAALADVCRLAGYEVLLSGGDTRWHAPAARAVLWDTPANGLSNTTAIEALRQAAGGAPILAMVTFPRERDLKIAQAAGLAGVIGKPLVIDDLLWQLKRVAQTHTPSTSPAAGRGT